MKKEKFIPLQLNYFFYVVIIIFVIMFQSGETTLFNLSKNLLLEFAFLIWFIGSIYLGQFKKIDFGYIEYFFIFLLFILISGFNAPDKQYVLLDFAKWSRLPLIYLLLANNIKSKEQLNIFLLMLGYFAGISLLYGLYEFVFHPDSFRITNRATSIFKIPTQWSFFIVAMLPILFLLLNQEGALLKQLFYLFLIILSGINLCLAKSRLGLLISLFLVAASIFIRVENKRIIEIFIKRPLFIISIIAFLIGAINGPILIKKIIYIINTDNSYAARQECLNIGLKIIRAHPILGIGAGNYSIVSKLYASYNYIDETGLSTGVHNVYLHIAVEAGLIAMVAFIIFLLLHIRLLFKLYKNITERYLKKFSQFLFLSLIVGSGYIIFDILPHTLIEWYFGISLGLVVVLRNLVKQEIS